MGTSPGKLYNCVMVYGKNEYWLKSLDSKATYFFRIEAVNENGTSDLSSEVRSE
jgi:hypothetical protein